MIYSRYFIRSSEYQYNFINDYEIDFIIKMNK